MRSLYVLAGLMSLGGALATALQTAVTESQGKQATTEQIVVRAALVEKVLSCLKAGSPLDENCLHDRLDMEFVSRVADLNAEHLSWETPAGSVLEGAGQASGARLFEKGPREVEEAGLMGGYCRENNFYYTRCSSTCGWWSRKGGMPRCNLSRMASMRTLAVKDLQRAKRRTIDVARTCVEHEKTLVENCLRRGLESVFVRVVLAEQPAGPSPKGGRRCRHKMFYCQCANTCRYWTGK